MDYAAMARFHWDHNADITVAVQPVAKDEANRFGILKRNSSYQLTEFAEKPRDPKLLAELASRDDPEKPFLGSMGIYLFRTETLFDLLNNYPLDDFGSHVIPQAITTHTVYGFDFTGYWEDIGTIRSFYETNLALTRPNPPFDFFDVNAPIYGGTRFLPCSTIHESQIKNALLAEGCCINHAYIQDSIIGLRSQIASGVKIEQSIIMGADYYQNPDIDRARPVPLGIGENTQIEGAIIDKNTCIGKGVVIRSFPRGTDLDSENWVVRDGIVVVPKNGVLMDGTYIGPGSKD
jgi:glucose-1-phosphate adenylyltransferase